MSLEIIQICKGEFVINFGVKNADSIHPETIELNVTHVYTNLTYDYTFKQSTIDSIIKEYENLATFCTYIKQSCDNNIIKVWFKDEHPMILYVLLGEGNTRHNLHELQLTIHDQNETIIKLLNLVLNVNRAKLLDEKSEFLNKKEKQLNEKDIALTIAMNSIPTNGGLELLDIICFHISIYFCALVILTLVCKIN